MERDTLIFDLIDRELNRQENGLELIASENFVSKQVMEAAGSVLTNKYAEGLPGKRYYGGCQVVDEVENIAIARAKQLFGAEWVNVQPHSGAQANSAVMLAVLKPGDKILGFDLSHGGHLTHGSAVNFSGKLYQPLFYGVKQETGLIDQQAKKNYNVPLTNIVYMGMGEPLLNYANVLKSIERITAPDGLNMASKRITVSTAGIAKMIKKLGDDGVKFNLALSLHAANDKKRNEIMPITEHNSLKALAESLKYYFSKTKNPVTYEYIVFNNFNDEIEDAMELAKFCKHVPCKVNLIEYNPIQFAAFTNAEGDKIDAFSKYLKSQGVNTNIRRSRGKDIDAACGQLAVKEEAQA
jgi:hypothetical protein